LSSKKNNQMLPNQLPQVNHDLPDIILNNNKQNVGRVFEITVAQLGS